MDGFRLILIGDMHEQPMLNFNLKPFVVMIKDWSSEVWPFNWVVVYLLQDASSFLHPLLLRPK